MGGVRIAAAAALMLAGAAALAQPYPHKPIRYVVGLAPGGPTDMLARLVAGRMTELLGQQMVVENRAGAGGVIAADIVAKATPDGYTLYNAGNTLAINAVLRPQLPYAALRDFAPVSLLMTTPNVLIVHPSLPVKSVSELVAFAKATPGKVNYASSGVGASPHLSMELLKSMAGIDLVHVPYKGGAPAMIDLLAGQVRVMFDNLPGQVAYIRSGKVRAIAVSSARRSPVLPETPTVAESGVPGFDVFVWYGIWGPAGLPAPVVAKLNGAVARLMAQPETKARLAELAVDPAPSTPEALYALLKSEVARWSKVVREAGIPTE